jgi:hypothetical protein
MLVHFFCLLEFKFRFEFYFGLKPFCRKAHQPTSRFPPPAPWVADPWAPPVIPSAALIPASDSTAAVARVRLEHDVLAWPARQGDRPGLYKQRRPQDAPHPSRLARAQPPPEPPKP